MAILACFFLAKPQKPDDEQTKSRAADSATARGKQDDGTLNGGHRSCSQPAAMAITSSDTTASQGASASASAGGTAASASASGASFSAQPSVSGPAAQQLIVRPPLDVYKKLAIVRLPDDEVMYQNADGSWGKVKNLDETRVVNKKRGGDQQDDKDDAEMTDEADGSNKSEDADDEKKEDGSEEVSRCEVDCQRAPSSIYLRISVVFCCC